jgi:hypothetical protein
MRWRVDRCSTTVGLPNTLVGGIYRRLAINGSSQGHMRGPLLKLVLVAAVSGVFADSLVAAGNIDVRRVQKSVIFLYAANGAGEVDKTKPLGTGFIVEYPAKDGVGKTRRAIVTARHIVDPEWAKCGTGNPSEIFARSNRDPEHGGSVGFFSVPLNREDRPWLRSSNDGVDVAVVPMDHIDTSQFDLASIKISEFPTKAEEKALDIGDQIVSAGLLPDLPGVMRNYPIFKFGRISSIPAEPIETQCNARSPKVFLNLWLIAVNLVSGNSGAPIFYMPSTTESSLPGNTRTVLLGVQSISFFGVGIAGMMPIKYVSEILAVVDQGDMHTDAQGTP